MLQFDVAPMTRSLFFFTLLFGPQKSLAFGLFYWAVPRHMDEKGGHFYPGGLNHLHQSWPRTGTKHQIIRIRDICQPFVMIHAHIFPSISANSRTALKSIGLRIALFDSTLNIKRPASVHRTRLRRVKRLNKAM